MQSLATDLLALATEMESRLRDQPTLPHHHFALFDPTQVRLFTASLPTE